MVRAESPRPCQFGGDTLSVVQVVSAKSLPGNRTREKPFRETIQEKSPPGNPGRLNVFRYSSSLNSPESLTLIISFACRILLRSTPSFSAVSLSV